MKRAAECREGKLAGCGVPGQIWLDAEMRAAPGTERFHQGNEFFPLGVQGVSDLWWARIRGSTREQSIALKFAQLVGQNFFGHSAKFLPQFGKAARPKGKVPKNLHLPLSGHGVDCG